MAVAGLTMKQGGQELPATRLAGSREAWKPTAADLQQFVGRYFSAELETFYTITLEQDTLVVRQRRLDDAKLTAGQTDRVAGGGLNFSSERDRNQFVIGFYVANGRTRDVRFERVGR